MPASGIYTVTVPGAVKGWEMMRARFGKLPMADLLAPAIFYAEDGFPVSDVIAERLERRDAQARRPDPHAAEVVPARRPRAERRRGLQESRARRRRCG